MQSKNSLMILLLSGLALLSTATIADTGFEASNQNVHVNVGGDIKFTGSPITATNPSLPNYSGGIEASNQNIHINTGQDIKFTGSPITATNSSLINNYKGINLSGLQTSHLPDNKIDKVTISKVNSFVKR